MYQVSDCTSSAVFGFFSIYVMSFLTSQWFLSYQGQIYNYGYLASFSTILQWFCFIASDQNLRPQSISKIKPEYSDILYIPTHFPGPCVCRTGSCTVYIWVYMWSPLLSSHLYLKVTLVFHGQKVENQAYLLMWSPLLSSHLYLKVTFTYP
jgi:hypothetical protein